MGTILLHAGLPKTGSSSIQNWLKRNQVKLQDAGWALLAEDRRDTAPTAAAQRRVRLCVHKSGILSGSNFITRYFLRTTTDNQRERIVGQFVEKLERLVQTHGKVILSTEGLGLPILRLDERWLKGLETLTDHHEVRLAVYVRPQDSAIEAAWRQWGFRSHLSEQPSSYIARRARLLHYWNTVEGIERIAPKLCLSPRPFRGDLLDGGSVVKDFVARFIGTDVPFLDEDSEIWANRGLPLDIINLLSHAEAGRFWKGSNDNHNFKKFKSLFSGLRIEDSPEVTESRVVLNRYCYDLFEPGNRKLIEAYGWATEHFVAPLAADPSPSQADLSQIDQLWKPRANATELEVLFHLLAVGLESGLTKPLR